MHYLFKLVKWEINYEKSVLIPSSRVTFLGALWSPTKVIRTDSYQRDAIYLVANKVFKIRAQEQASAANLRFLIPPLLGISFPLSTKFYSPWTALDIPRFSECKYFVNLASVATETQIAALEMAIPLNQEIKFSLNNKLVNELNEALLYLDMARQVLNEACFDSFKPA